MHTHLEPTILWISGPPDSGKSTLGGQLETLELPVFRIDTFLIALPDWCPDRWIAEQALHFGVRRIREFLDCVAREGKAGLLAQWLVDSERGFSPRPPLSVIEGYLPAEMQRRVVGLLERRGHRVWVAERLSTS